MEFYDKINSFHIKDDFFLFFDIFARNNELIVVFQDNSYSKNNMYNIKYKYNNEWKDIELISTNNIVYCNCSLFINTYNFNMFDTDQKIEIYVECDGKTNTYNIYYINELKQKYFLTLTTLFKDDHYLLDMFINYYKKHGVEEFILYYNDDINKLNTIDILNKHNDVSIKFIEWNFVYWLNGIHNAQSAQTNHVLYKYNKLMATYTIYNDLDEYMYINKNTKIVDFIKLINNINSNNIDTIGFLNKWCDTIDGKIPETVPSEIIVDSSTFSFGIRSKCIHLNSCLNKMSMIHTPMQYDYNKSNIKLFSSDNLRLFHFFKWSKPTREIKFTNPYNLSIKDSFLI